MDTPYVFNLYDETTNQYIPSGYYEHGIALRMLESLQAEFPEDIFRLTVTDRSSGQNYNITPL